MAQLCVASDKIPGATDSAIFMVPTYYSSVATGAEYNEHGEEESFKRDDPNANSPSIKELCSRATEEQHELKKVDVIATIEEHNMTVDNPLTASKDEQKMEYCQQQPEVSRNEECLINIIKGVSISAGLSWYLVDEVYIPINCGNEFHWVLAFVVLKERRIRVYDSILRRRCSKPLSEIQKLDKILPTYLDMSGFLDQKVRIDWLTIEAYRDKIANPFDVQYVDGISQQTIGSLNCGSFISAYAEYLSDALQVPNDGLDAGLLRKRYFALL
ncbi:hypothetical protein FXO38_27101 [Capsicum annuum]|nr:hypothetical protein FXO38_27101 [Capsicum annuum]